MRTLVKEYNEKIAKEKNNNSPIKFFDEKNLPNLSRFWIDLINDTI